MIRINEIRNKMTTALLLFVVIGLVIANNFNERKNSAEIIEGISSIYEDRLVVESYIFQYLHHFQQINSIIDTPGLDEDVRQELIASPLLKIEELNTLYWQTKLTDEEKLNFTSFTRMCSDISLLSKTDLLKTKELSEEAIDVLHTLSSIQIAEAKSQMDNLNSLYSFSSITSQLEIGILIVIAFIIQVLVFSPKKPNSLKDLNPYNLN